jgi:hypothetical protein
MSADLSRTSPWADDTDGCDPDDLAILAGFDCEMLIAALRRRYINLRAGGWEEIASIRIAMKELGALIDETTRPKLSVVSDDKSS